ncbi:hypothetical protein ES332_A01G192600v1 [Gossypium tomentosum]|uniref:Pentatricopeptide repeat-containing protein n=1 Tax=Gossypium tomentosum TaxID=34277 RepID=A0A5D2RSP2_GOSTO|nr:hypothetical protein ES332_A01G192600v1 [Gossypium tomentosum]
MRFEKLRYDIGVGSMDVKEECCEMTIHANCKLQICELYKTMSSVKRIQVHCRVISLGFGLTLFIGSSLMNLHLHMGLDNVALKLFDQLPDRHFNLISWDSIIPAYSETDVLSDTLELVKRMHFCVEEGDTLFGRQSQCFVTKIGGYSTLPIPNVFCFTSIINGYAQNEMGREGVSLLEAMVHQGLIPDEVTSLRVLSGCNHAGLAKEGKLVFNLMKSFYGICPERSYFACMIYVIVGLAGLLCETEEQTPGGVNSVRHLRFRVIVDLLFHPTENLGTTLELVPLLFT